ncbi:LacI family DNA-binding transcriptional regulator [Terrisporobacter petrolearius]|uniref:LacI family DNA-binding transcriptional regulator n=1 Tax=Terrisporobacter petrolearius TaxID=1460447 RepID=UPI003AFFFDC1
MDIREIAKKAGVSVATVSRVQNHPETVAKATREKVQAVIDECHYTPNWFARGMNLGKAETIGIIVPDILNPSYMEIIKGIEDIMSESGYITVICDGSYNCQKEEESIDSLIKRNTDGLIIISSSISRKKLLSIKSKGIPIVSIGESNACKEIDTVKIDYEKASYKATKHLIDIGYDKIAIINGPKEKRENTLRLEGFKRALENSNINVENNYVLHSQISLDEGYLLTKKLLKLKNPPRAIFATNDIFAFASMAALRDNDIKVPEDIAVIGFDNIQLSRMIESKLTTIINPLHKQGVLGARLLIDIINNQDSEDSFTQEILLETKIKIRKSCGYGNRIGEIF